jgi:hypothetical protein
MHDANNAYGPGRLVRPSHDPQIRLFGVLVRAIWVAAFLLTAAIEAIPRDPLWGPHLFYPYTLAKAVLFLLLGFMTPLAIWNFSTLGLGFVFAIAAAGSIEGAQHFLPGHQASFLEFAAKVVLLIFGFAAALVVRNDHCLQIGRFRLHLADRHSSEID